MADFNQIGQDFVKHYYTVFDAGKAARAQLANLYVCPSIRDLGFLLGEKNTGCIPCFPSSSLLLFTYSYHVSILTPFLLV